MKISSETLNIFKNFSTINHSIVVEEGNVLKSISPMKNIFVRADVVETFPRKFAIYELTEFLGGLSLFKDPEFDFSNPSYVLIKDGRSKVKYVFSDPSVITSAPEKDIELPSVEVQFVLSTDTLNTLQRAAGVYQLPDLSLVGDGSQMQLVVRDNKNDSSHNYCIDVGETSATFNFNFKVENIKILPGDYNVSMCSKGISLFENTSLNLKYWIALEPNSQYES
jgi:hypothetical protein